MKIETGFSQKQLGHFEPNFVRELLVRYKEININDMMLVT